MDQVSWQRYCSLIGEESLHLEYSESAIEASFDIDKRIITAPCFEFLDEETTQMLVSREVAHAKYTLYSPKKYDEYKEKFHSLFDVAEDAYVEQKIKTEYKGLASIFSHGYKKLYEHDFYALEQINLETLPLISRLNLYCKIGHCIDIPFLNKEELGFSIRISSLKSNKEVIKFCEDVLEYLEKEQHQEKAQQPSSLPSQEEKEKKEESSQSPKESESSETQEQEEDQEEQEDQEENSETEAEDSEEDSEEESEEEKSEQEDSEDTEEQRVDDDEMTESSSLEEAQGDGENQGERNGDGQEEAQGNTSSQQTRDGGSGRDLDLEDSIEKQCKKKIRAYGKKLISPNQKEILSISTKDYADIVFNLSIVYNEFVTDIPQRTKARFVQLVKRLAVIVHTTFMYNKTAYEQKTSYHKSTGKIDLRKLFQYRTSNSIFKTRVYKREGQSHGIVIMLDCSSSMEKSQLDVSFLQASVLGQFCKMANIPFEILAFGLLVTEDFHTYTMNPSQLVNLGNSDHFDIESMLHILYIIHRKRPRIGDVNHYNLVQGSTPTLEGVLASANTFEKFKRNGIEKTYLYILTDGDQNNSILYKDRKNDFFTDVYVDTIKKVNIDNVLYSISDKLSEKDFDMDWSFELFVDMLKKRYNTEISLINIVNIELYIHRISNRILSYFKDYKQANIRFRYSRDLDDYSFLFKHAYVFKEDTKKFPNFLSGESIYRYKFTKSPYLSQYFAVDSQNYEDFNPSMGNTIDSIYKFAENMSFYKILASWFISDIS